MKTSNVSLFSNVYVVRADTKFADKEFMKRVFDPEALKSAGKMGIVLDEVQRGVLKGATSCAYGDGFTYGIRVEDGKMVYVNVCEKTECPLYEKCSKGRSFRKINFPDDITPPGVLVVNSEWSPLSGKINLTDITLKRPYKIAKVAPKPQTAYVGLTLGKNWAVRGFWRRLSSGELTYVHPHLRYRHEGDEFVTIFRSPKYRLNKLDYEKTLEKFKVRADEQKSEERKKTPETRKEGFASDRLYQLQKVRPIDSPEEIITARAGSKILVNSGPGTGKTYSVIERLKYIAGNGLVDPENVLVLCFSRNAVKVINERLLKAVEAGEIGASARDFQICTFDSFATWYLMNTDEHLDLSGIGYDERISLFINAHKKDPERLNKELKYLIVDEVQDLVGIRAKLVKELLQDFDGSDPDRGFLLLGDLCQAIYDYQIESEDELKASDLYRWIETEAPFKDEIREYEMTEDRRHDVQTAALLRPLRDAMLHNGIEAQDEELETAFKKFQSRGYQPHEGDTVAYLYRSNASAFRKSRELYEAGVAHNFLAGTRRVIFRRELADIFSRCSGEQITKEKFFSLGCECGIEEDVLTDIWKGLLHALDEDDHDGQTIRFNRLGRALSMEKRVGDSLLAKDDSKITVSTIHKAKGSEYDFVNLESANCQGDPDEVKVHYVALTRAKKGLSVTGNRYSFDIDPHDTTTTRHYTMNKFRTRITGYELGMDGDIDPIGFVDAGIEGDVEKRQEYIAENVKRGDKVSVMHSDGKHYIVHNGHVIGSMCGKSFINIKALYKSGKSYTFRMYGYVAFTELYVKDVVAVFNKKLDSRIDKRYADKNFWYGIDFCGMAVPINAE